MNVRLDEQLITGDSASDAGRAPSSAWGPAALQERREEEQRDTLEGWLKSENTGSTKTAITIAF